MIKNMLPTPPKPQFSSIFDLFWSSFGHVFDLKSIYVRTRIESNDPMFKLHKEKKVTTLCSNRVGVARPATSAIQKTTAEPNSKDHDSHIQDRSFWAGGTPKGLQFIKNKYKKINNTLKPQVQHPDYGVGAKIY